MTNAANYIIDMSNVSQKRDFLSRLGELHGMHHITIKERKSKRSLPFNALYWVSAVQPFARALRDQGEIVTDEEAHGILKARFLRVETNIVNPSTGEMEKVEYVESTTQLDNKQFGIYYEQVSQFLAEWFGIVVVNNTEQFSETN